MGMASGMEVGAAVCTDSTVAVGGDVVSAGGRAWGGTRGGVAEASAAAGLGRAVRAGVGGVGAPMGTQPLYPAGPAASASAARAADSAVAASMNSCRGVVGFGAVVGGVSRGRLASGLGAVVVGVPRGTAGRWCPVPAHRRAGVWLRWRLWWVDVPVVCTRLVCCGGW